MSRDYFFFFFFKSIDRFQREKKNTRLGFKEFDYAGAKRKRRREIVRERERERGKLAMERGVLYAR